MSFGEPPRDLHSEGDRRSDRQLPRSQNEALQIFPGDIFHRDVVNSVRFIQVIHPTDVLMDDLTGEFQLVAETLEGLLIGGDFRFQELQGHDFLYLVIEDLEDFAHSSPAEFFNDLVPVRKEGACRQFLSRRVHGPGIRDGNFLGSEERSRAFLAILRIGRIIRVASRACIRHD